MKEDREAASRLIESRRLDEVKESGIERIESCYVERNRRGRLRELEEREGKDGG